MQNDHFCGVKYQATGADERLRISGLCVIQRIHTQEWDNLGGTFKDGVSHAKEERRTNHEQWPTVMIYCTL